MGIAVGIDIRSGGGKVELDPNKVTVLIDDDGDYLVTDDGDYLGTRTVNNIIIE